MVKPAPPDAEFTIRDLAETFDVTPRALRFYEQKGLITPHRRGATRLYSAADRARLALILRGKRVGFSLDEIKEMLDLEALDSFGRDHLERALERFRARIDDLKGQRKDIDDAIGELEAGCRWMEERLADREPPEEVKRRARAFEALAAARLTQWATPTE
ncbi:transcriptional regulator [Marinicauda salina]|jgi:DNA-binding transcriptional MerR regulator|uniref:Transcriptional regulator n=1 Tax=Marinicauda salina TaxID=2135793 RepID=A0A2U2BY17_9PROT|nr:MerR family DNA-binding transcriptional regulator [Marinicauda salina]PWE18887.1 transcriptional regulator [Marinicauda salina]